MTGVGSVVAGRFRLERPLGHGGMGEVWVAFDERLAARCAVKFLQPTSDPKAEARFHREAQTAAQLRSPYVVAMLDHGTSEGRTYLAMELLDGEDLSKRLRRLGKLDPLETVRLVTHIGRALTRAHGLGLIHRDLKPANVVVVRDEDGPIAKVLDFGIAKVSADLRIDSTKLDIDRIGDVSLEQTMEGRTLGTPTHMSPEHVKGERLDHRADLWALGVIAYECVTGLLPFRSTALAALVIEITERPFPAPSSLQVSLSPAVDAWFQRALAKDREARFGDAKEMTNALAVAFGAPAQATRLASASPQRLVEPAVPESLPFAPTQALNTGARRSRRWLWSAIPAALGFAGLGLALARPQGREAVTTTTSAETASASVSAGGLATPASAAPDADAARAAFGDMNAIVEIAANSQTLCVRFGTGRVACWGTNAQFDSPGAGATSIARDVLLGRSVDRIEGEGATTCALIKGEGVRCFQASSPIEALATSGPFDRFVLANAGACGISSGKLECVRPDGSGKMQRIMLSNTATEVTLGSEFGCWLERDGKGHCWRAPPGLSTPAMLDAGLVPKRVPALDGAVFLRGGASHACAIRADRRVVCVGAPTLGVLGTAHRSQPIQMEDSLGSVRDDGRISVSVVPDLVDVVELVAGSRFTCAVTGSRRLFCWGANGSGQLGRGRVTAMEPAPALTLERVRVVGAGSEHACAVTADGQLFCWGRASESQLARAPREPCEGFECQPKPSLAAPW